MAAGSSRLVTARWVGIAAFLIAASIHSATMVAASQLPPVGDLLGGGAAPTEDVIDLDLEEEVAIVGPITPPIEPPEVDQPPTTAAPPLDEEHEDSAEPPAPSTVAPAPQAVAAAPSETATEDEAAEDEMPAPGPPVGGPASDAPPAGPTGAAPAPGGIARYGIGDGVDEYGDPALTAPFGGTSVLGQFALGPSVGAPTTTPGAKAVTGDTVNKVLNGSVASQDKKKGITFPGAGVVSSTVTTAVRGIALPHNARGTIEVTIAPGGKVTSARVVSSSAGDAGTWEGAAQAIKGSLAGQTLDLGDAAKTGAVVRLSVTQKHVYPTGTAKGADVKPVCANQVINDMIDAADPNASNAKDGAGVPVFTDEHGRPCIPVGVSAVADASNIGANKHIEVQTSMDVTIPGQKDLPVDIAPVNTDAPWVQTPSDVPRPVLPQKMRKRISDKKKKK